MQLVALKLPEALLVKVTVPVGVLVVPDEVSETVAVQVVGAFATTGLVEQLTVAEVERLLTDKLKVPEPLLWSVSPP